MNTCPGCGHLLDHPDDCPRCEYFNLASGRYHYCGDPTCHCKALANSPIRAAVLADFAEDFEAQYGGRTYREMAAERLGITP